MGSFDIFDQIQKLRKSGEAFCVATVVRTADVTSAKAGAKAAVTASGEIIGHLGGGCVKRAVKTAGQDALRTGEALMIRVKPSEKVVSLTDEDGAQVYKSGCPSGGTVDLLIEPFEMPPMLVVFGHTPISEAIAAHGHLAGYRIATSTELGFESASKEFQGTDISDLGIGERDFIVVASQGAQDLASLRAAIESPARRVSMVASSRKAEVLGRKLVDAGVAEAQVARLKSPAGIDLKAIDPHDIALSVMAEIVLWRNTDMTSQEKEAGNEGSV